MSYKICDLDFFNKNKKIKCSDVPTQIIHKTNYRPVNFDG